MKNHSGSGDLNAEVEVLVEQHNQQRGHESLRDLILAMSIAALAGPSCSTAKASSA